tara:strand:+ start:259 stop:582 length:324 start_codon:yes stop_codon:yes gene_type:complete
MENQDTPKDILMAYYNEINSDVRLENISGRYNKESILNLLENIIDQPEEDEMGNNPVQKELTKIVNFLFESRNKLDEMKDAVLDDSWTDLMDKLETLESDIEEHLQK